MTLTERVRKVLASQAEIEADEERADALRVPGCCPVAALPHRERASVSGVLRSVTLRPREGVPAIEAELYDGSGSLNLVWLGRRQIVGIEPGRRLKVDGMVSLVDGRRTVFNPRYELRARPGE
ncbi:OB-fold nucleic acid binding domain-containing protein [Cellulomonas dongxiuzhuiae]|uniref:OB-fold nucleic acid binding domain-containing protein n=1 Tax=Cellulomonas dongxiuzhuiae TaxID=2819979 RepID=A0ABX8GNA2_9CELL|nr:OB-fold nucleic acid binding domain-containing protein [Cellulomonas dongxiuzhuiae]MBO3087340.1 OB-fold nucleic acid binding domain-containing protein [Cellulomonas dongxiuzhuiae]MBO3093263.1 OB-fold nucleic acid binding domain-containing protein [Cellulomonas dongxiuzhuiae]QWC17550.1 OB-fold nucleic acid binding domain-containing protein [Cellulomonas dongxiuzhuiae]